MGRHARGRDGHVTLLGSVRGRVPLRSATSLAHCRRCPRKRNFPRGVSRLRRSVSRGTPPPLRWQERRVEPSRRGAQVCRPPPSAGERCACACPAATTRRGDGPRRTRDLPTGGRRAAERAALVEALRTADFVAGRPDRPDTTACSRPRRCLPGQPVRHGEARGRRAGRRGRRRPARARRGLLLAPARRRRPSARARSTSARAPARALVSHRASASTATGERAARNGRRGARSAPRTARRPRPGRRPGDRVPVRRARVVDKASRRWRSTSARGWCTSTDPDARRLATRRAASRSSTSRPTVPSASCCSSTARSRRRPVASARSPHDENARDSSDTARSAYDAVIGFDHRTLSVDPRAERQGPARAAQHAPARRRARHRHHHAQPRRPDRPASFVESRAPGLGLAGTASTAIIFVASTNGGTHLADPERWHDLVDLYTNLASVGAAGALAAMPGGAPVAAVVAESSRASVRS